MTSLGDEPYVLVTTYKRDGSGVGTPVWVVPYGENRIAFWTALNVGKGRRLRRDPRVTLQPCGRYGDLIAGGDTTEGTASIHDGEVLREVYVALEKKYGDEFREMHAGASEQFPQSIAVVVELDTSAKHDHT